MLSKPEAGWTDFSIDGKHIYSLSYLNDIAFDWLEQAIHGLYTMQPFAVYGFCEPNRMVCTVSHWNCYVVFEGDEMSDTYSCIEMYCVELSMADFCKMLYSDISENIDTWVHWDDGDLRMAAESRYDEEYAGDEEYNEEHFEKVLEKLFAERKQCLEEKLKELKELIDNSAKYFRKREEKK